MTNMVEQLQILFSAMESGDNVNDESPLVRIGLATLYDRPDINTTQMSLSSFNALLSRNHGRCKIPVINFPATNRDTEFRNAVTSAIENFIISESEIDTNLESSLKYIVDENIDNITEHANTAVGYICAAWNNEVVTICIADAGKTIYRSYIDGDFEDIHSEQLALQAAISGVSTKNRPGAESRGYGISTSSNMIVNGMDATLVILSGRGMLFHNSTRNDFTELPESIFMRGTLICFTIPTRRQGYDMYNYIGG